MWVFSEMCGVGVVGVVWVWWLVGMLGTEVWMYVVREVYVGR